ncbi:DUF4203 domain-containing protein [Candidatus Saccharibacteria bacterium]|nr:DUF4203 domain-containing protein [Candidatus Saccharibacteria bacterium]
MNIELFFARIQIPEVIVMAVVGLLLLFMGYRIKKVGFFIIWFLIGYNLMLTLLSSPTIESFLPDAMKTEFWSVLLPVAGGLLLALLGFSIEKLCVGGMVFGMIIMLTAQYFGTEIQTLVIGAIIGIVLAGLAVTLMKPTIIVATSLMGAYALTITLLYFVTSIDKQAFYFPILIGLTILGSAVQFATTKNID